MCLSGNNLLVDCLELVLSIWQVVFLFGWFFLLFVSSSCSLAPWLWVYQQGVALTCLGHTLTMFIQLLSTSNQGEEDIVLLHQTKKDQVFNSTTRLLLLVHLAWFIFGTLTLLPVFFLHRLYEKGTHRLWEEGCESPLHFWFCFLLLVLQFCLLMVVGIWYMVGGGRKVDSVEYQG